MTHRLAIASLLLAACSSAPAPTPDAPADAPPPASSSVASAAVDPTPSEAPKAARPEPPEGWERLGFALAVRSKEALGVTLDVPAKWSIDGARERGLSFQSCMSHSAVPFGPSIFVDARSCEDKESVDACVDRFMKNRSDGPVGTDAPPGAKVRWYEGSRLNKRAGVVEQWQGAQLVYDEAHNAIVYCGYNMSVDPEPIRAQYKKICSSLTLDPTAADKDLKPRAASPEGAIGNAATVEHGDELTKAALAFHAALMKGDVKAAESLLSTTAFCEAAKGAEAARCKQKAKKAHAVFEKEFPTFVKAAPKATPAGFWLMAASPDANEPGYVAYPISADKPCNAYWEGGYPMVWIAGKATIADLTSAEDEHQPKKRKVKTK